MNHLNDYNNYAAAQQFASSRAAGNSVPPPPPQQRALDFVVEKNAADYLHSHFNKVKQEQVPLQAPTYDPYTLPPQMYTTSTLDEYGWKQSQQQQQYLPPGSGYYVEPAFAPYGYEWYPSGGEHPQAIQQYYYQPQQVPTRGHPQHQLQQQMPMDDPDVRHVSPPIITKRIGYSDEEGTSKKRSRGSSKRSSAAAAAASTVSQQPPEPTIIDGEVIPMRSFPVSIHGETRLNIKFISLGEPGGVIQKFGKHNCAIPNGLSGTHQMYDQRWRFEVQHVVQGPATLIRFNITNLTSGTITSVTETIQDAMVRETCGRTICNNVLKNALEIRAVELENSVELVESSNPTRAANIRNLIKVLRPKRCTVGLLFFGLLHECVQTNHERMVLARRSPHSDSAGPTISAPTALSGAS